LNIILHCSIHESVGGCNSNSPLSTVAAVYYPSCYDNTNTVCYSNLTYERDGYRNKQCTGKPISKDYLMSDDYCQQAINFEYAFGYAYTGCVNNTMNNTNTCFAGSEAVTLEDGSIKAISDVKIGDIVLSYSSSANELKFAKVVAVPHGANQIHSKFSHIVTKSGKDIKLTPEHLILSGPCSGELSLVRASDVKVNECLKSTSGLDEVVSNGYATGRGVYTVITTEEFIVVNGFVASPFAVNHFVAHSFYSIHRYLQSSTLTSWLLKSESIRYLNQLGSFLADIFVKAL